MSAPRTTPRRIRAGVVAHIAIALAVLGLAPVALAAVSAEPPAGDSSQATATAAQTLTWTASDSTTAYASVTTEATAGPATIVFENSAATGNTSGMQHTLTFDTITEGYNHDVDLNIMAFPSDDSGGRHTAEVVLSPGTYRFFCSIPGHGQMTGELVVTDGGGGGDDDTTPPTVTATVDGEKNADGAYLDAARVSLTAADESGVESVEYALDGGAWTTYTEPVLVTEIGEHTVGYRATDTAGNTSEMQEVSFEVVQGSGADVTAPEARAMLHGETNADGDYVGSAEVMLTATDAGSGVESVEYALDGGTWTEYADPVTVDTVGEHSLSYRATDQAGNVSVPEAVAFTVVPGQSDDTEAPQVTATVAGKQRADWTYDGAVTVTVVATDAGSGVKSTEYSVDDKPWTAYTQPVEVDTVGRHTVRYRATDAAGNVSAVGSSGFEISTSATPAKCTSPDPSPTVVIGDVGTGVRNRVADGSCTIDDLIRDESRWADHGSFVDHVKAVVDGLLADGTVTTAERRAILSAARQSEIGSDQ
jgi:hypothetical protein